MVLPNPRPQPSSPIAGEVDGGAAKKIENESKEGVSGGYPEEHNDPKPPRSGRCVSCFAGASGRCRAAILGLTRAVRKSFYKLGYRIALHPGRTVIIMITLACVLGLGLVRFHTEDRGSKLWIPQDTLALDHRRWVEQYYPPFLRAELFIFVGRQEGENLATRDSLLQMLDVLQVGENTTTEYEGQPLTFPDLCFTESDGTVTYCRTASALDLFYDSAFLTTDASGSPSFLETVRAKLVTLTDEDVQTTLTTGFGESSSWNGGPLLAQNFMGSVSGANETLKVEAFRAFHLLLNNLESIDGGEERDYRARAWEKQWIINLNGVELEEDVQQYIMAVRSEDDEMEAAISGDISKFVLGYFLLFGYLCSVLGELHRIYGRVLLGLGTIFSIGLTILSTFGLCSLLGLFYGPVHQVLPLLLLGIGADDAFVIVTALDELTSTCYSSSGSAASSSSPSDASAATSPSSSTESAVEEGRPTEELSGLPPRKLEEKIALALSHGGTAVTVTSLTNSVAFFISSSTSLPALSGFAVWAAVGILIDYFMSVTLFVAFLTWDTARQEKRKYDLIPCKTAKPKKGQNREGKSSCRDGDITFENDVGHSGGEEASGRGWTESQSSKTAADKRNADPKSEATNVFGLRFGVLSRCFGDWYGPFITRPWIRYLIVCLFLGGLGVSIYGVTQLHLDFKFSYFYSDGSYQKEYSNLQDEYFPDLELPASVYTQQIDYADADIQRTLYSLCGRGGTMTQNKYVVGGSMDCWYEAMRSYYGLNGSVAEAETASVFSEDDFWPNLVDFLQADQGARFQDDLVIVNANSSDPIMVASRFSFELTGLDSNEDEVDAMETLREDVVDSGLPRSFAYSLWFIFGEQLAVIGQEATQNAFLALIAVLIVTFLLVPDVRVALITVVGVGMTLMDVLGIMYYWDINLSSVSVINLTLAVGLSIDYSAHMALAFMEQPVFKDRQKAQPQVLTEDESEGGDTNSTLYKKGQGQVCENEEVEERRQKRERVVNALRHIGSPLVHGGISTFLAVSVLVTADSYVFQIFFKMFLLIISLGMAHGLVLVPVLLLLLGPNDAFYRSDKEKDALEREFELSVRRKALTGGGDTEKLDRECASEEDELGADLESPFVPAATPKGSS